MRLRRKGAVINVTSFEGSASLPPFSSLSRWQFDHRLRKLTYEINRLLNRSITAPFYAIYGASKAFVDSFSASMAVELKVTTPRGQTNSTRPTPVAKGAPHRFTLISATPLHTDFRRWVSP